MKAEAFFTQRCETAEDAKCDPKICGTWTPVLQAAASTARAKKGRYIPRTVIRGDAEPKKKFQEAQAKERKQFQEYGAVEVLSRAESEKLKHTAVGMRWVATDKNESLRSETNPLTVHAKERLVAQGFAERMLGMFRADAPTSALVSHNVLAQLTASLGHELESIDVKGAYLSGEDLDREVILGQPKGGLAGVEDGVLLRAVKGLYGLSDAARKWWLELRSVLLDVGYEQNRHEPSLFGKYAEDGSLVSACCTHVDDLLFCFSPGEEAEETRKKLAQKLNVGKWQTKEFTYTGREYRQLEDKTVEVRMESYIDSLKPARVSRERRAKPESPLTASENTMLRSIVGQLVWLQRCLLPELAFAVSELSGYLVKPEVQHLVKANTLVQRARKLRSRALRFRPVSVNGPLVRYSDSPFASLKDDKSQAGYRIFFVEPGVKEAPVGKMSDASLWDWKSGRHKRMVRSTMAAGTYGLSDCASRAQWIRGLFDELLTGKHPVLGVSMEPQRDVILVTDAKAVFDHLRNEKGGGAADKRVALELNLLRSELEEARMEIRWAPTNHQLADALTKEFPLGAPQVEYLQKVLDSGEVTLGPDWRSPPDSRGRTVAAQVEEMRQALKTKSEEAVAVVQEIWFEVSSWLKKVGRPPLDSRGGKSPESLKRRLRRKLVDASDPLR